MKLLHFPLLFHFDEHRVVALWTDEVFRIGSLILWTSSFDNLRYTLKYTKVLKRISCNFVEEVQRPKIFNSLN